MSFLTIAVGATNFILGMVYLQYGTMTMAEMIRNRQTLGFSHFGAAWIAMAFTCGPHHFVHGTHMLLEGRAAGSLDLIAVLIGFPAGVIWFLLRVEAFRGGRGDRFIKGSPLLVVALPTLLAVYVTGLIAATLQLGPVDLSQATIVLPNLMLIGIYGAIGYFLARTQIHNRRPLGGWSVSGLALAVIFPTCALMHGIYALYAMTGLYADIDWHGYAIDWLAVPAGLYFLWVVHALYQGRFLDWNVVPGRTEARIAADVGPEVGPEVVPAPVRSVAAG